ncbi:MAG: hypothetical protein KZQ95_07870 [Candidatus Thiodiazotropha sp. (ex Epidulcina cf. delphinae)]|nr:hypothetical protein [Candidatus Thiodiazotropha sp. (ex Epidulcina cf. delphinae)]
MRLNKTKQAKGGAWALMLIAALAICGYPSSTVFAFEYHHVDSCHVCHNLHSFGGSNLKLIWEVIQTPNSGPKPVVFTATTGPNSYADGDAVYDGVCEVCHTLNQHHLNDGSDNTDHFDGEQCTDCHTHGNEFAPPFAQAHKTHVHDAKGPHLDCTDCHADPLQFDPTIFADGLDFQNTTVCDSCHSPGGDYDGIADPVIGAKSNWTEGVYENDQLKAGKEKWCVGCHDDAPSLIANVSAPNIAGDEDAVTPYGAGWGFYKTGHGLPSSEVYPSSGGKGAGRECLDCHDAGMSHIDGDARTYAADGDYLTWDPASAGYQNGYRLKDIAGGYEGKYPMHIPRTGHVFPPGFRESQEFALCFSCHDENNLYNGGDPVTGEGATTNFRNNLDGTWTSLHNLHTDGRNGPFGPTTPQYDSDFDGVAESRISCPACHNVHGSPSPAMVRHGELISTPGTTDKVPSLDFQYTPEGTYPVLGDSTGGKTRFIGGGPGNPAKNGVCNMCHNDQTIYTRSPVFGTPPDTPSNLTPLDGATSVETTPLLTSSAYADPDPTDLHQASQWQVTTTLGDYSTPVYDSGASADLTSHQVVAALNNATAYYWRVRHQNSTGAWSDFSTETTFSTVAGGAGQSVSLNPSGVVNAGAYTPNTGSTWASALDSDDGDASYVKLCCTSPSQTFTVSMDDPVGLGGTTIQAVTIHISARYLAGPWPGAVPYLANVDVGYKTGTSTTWSGSVALDTSGNYNQVISQTFTTDSDGGPLDLADIDNLQITVKRQTSGPPLLRVTEIRAEVDFTY